MTYQSNDYQTYEFTAWRESDLVSGNLGTNTVFHMPALASAEIAVTDNDGFLSGDSKCDENADDWSGQQASITVDGNEVGSGGQIYAELYWWVKDDAGNWYMLIEIEQEGSSTDYFTFHEAYGVPPEGARLTVCSSCNITDGGWQPDYKCLTAGDLTPPTGWIKGRLTIDADANDNEWNDSTGSWDAGVAGQVVQLLDLDGNVVAESTTDSDGNYMFDVPAGD